MTQAGQIKRERMKQLRLERDNALALLDAHQKYVILFRSLVARLEGEMQTLTAIKQPRKNGCKQYGCNPLQHSLDCPKHRASL